MNISKEKMNQLLKEKFNEDFYTELNPLWGYVTFRSNGLPMTLEHKGFINGVVTAMSQSS